MEGTLAGQGHLIYNGGWESDFDFTTSHLKMGSCLLENRGTLHLYYSSAQGVFFRGLDLQVLQPEPDAPCIDCKIELLQYDSVRSHWVLNHALVHFPPNFFPILAKSPSLLQCFNFQDNVDFLADIDCASDFSTLSWRMKEGFFPFHGEVHHIQNLELLWDQNTCQSAFEYPYHGHLLKIEMKVDSNLEGRLIVEDVQDPRSTAQPLTIDGSYGSKGLMIHAIEGSCGGIEASFQREANWDCNTLIGSARLEVGTLAEFVPAKIAEVFRQLQMGKG